MIWRLQKRGTGISLTSYIGWSQRKLGAGELDGL
jgi:hypothetical protein